MPKKEPRATRRRRELLEARRATIYARMQADPAYCHAKLAQWSKDVVAFVSDAVWVPDEHGDFGGGAVPYAPYERQKDLLKLLDWLVERQDDDVQRRRDAMAKKSRQVGFTATVLAWAWHAWLFRPSFPIILTSYEEDAVDKGGKGARIAEHLFGKLRKMQDELVERVPCLRFNLGVLSRGDSYDITPTGATKSEDVKFQLVRPKWIVHGIRVYQEAEGNVLKGDLPDDTTGKSRSYALALFDEISEGRAQLDWAMWTSCAPCCRHIFGWGTIPKDAREDCLLYKGTETPEKTMTPFWFHWTRIPIYMQGAYFKCKNDQCGKEIEWPYSSPAGKLVEVICPCCNKKQSVGERDLRSPWYDDQCSVFNNDPIAIARYLQGDWDASTGDAVFYTFNPMRSVVAREKEEVWGWEARHGFDPGKNKRNPACWLLSMFDPDSHVLRYVGYWMKHGKPIEWWLPFVAQIPYRKLDSMKVLAGPHVGKRWLEVHHYSEQERRMIDYAASFPKGPIRADPYGNNDHGGAGAAYEVWKRHKVSVSCPRYAVKKGGKWAVVEKARDLYMPTLEIDPFIAEMHPIDGNEVYLTLKSALSKVKQADTETGKGEPTRDFDKRVPKHASHPADAHLCIVYDLPNKIEGRVTPGGGVVHKGAREDDEDETGFGESLGSLSFR